MLMQFRSKFVPSCLLACSLSTATLVSQAPQTDQNTPGSYTLRVPVNEISLTFHAFDSHGAPLTQLQKSDLRLSDEGKPQEQIVMLESLTDLPIRAGFLFDASASMMEDLAMNRSIIRMYASRLLRKEVDRAFVMQFAEDTLVTQSWTGDASLIAAGAARVGMRKDRLAITSIFDSLYTACRDQWSADQGEATGNFILLFSDGDDDASHAYPSEAVDMCQRTRTAIYAIANNPKTPFDAGQKTLEELTNETGGRIFFQPQGDQIWEDLKLIEAEQRNQYRLEYKPEEFKANGAFHRIKLGCSVKGARIVTRSGYYAFARR